MPRLGKLERQLLKDNDSLITAAVNDGFAAITKQIELAVTLRKTNAITTDNFVSTVNDCLNDLIAAYAANKPLVDSPFPKPRTNRDVEPSDMVTGKAVAKQRRIERQRQNKLDNKLAAERKAYAARKTYDSTNHATIKPETKEQNERFVHAADTRKAKAYARFSPNGTLRLS